MILETIKWLVYALAIAGAMIVWFNRSRLPFTCIMIGVYLGFGFLAQFSGKQMLRFFDTNVGWYNFALFVNFILSAVIFLSMFKSGRNKQVAAVIFGLTGMALIYFLLHAGFGRFASRGLTIMNLAVPLVVLMYFYEMLQTPETRPISTQGRFWIASAFLIYHLSSYTSWMSYELFEQTSRPKILPALNIVITFVFYSLLVTSIQIEIKYLKNAEHQ